MKENKEKEILQLLRTNPDQGLKLALDAYGGAVMTICRNILFDCNPEDIEETAADSFVGLWRSIKNFKEDQEYSLKSYLYGITRHTALDKRRKLKKQILIFPIDEVPTEQMEMSIDIEADYFCKLNAHTIHKAVNEMREPDRSIFILRYFYFAKVKDIASNLGLTPKIVENRLYYGKSKLRNIILEGGLENVL